MTEDHDLRAWRAEPADGKGATASRGCSFDVGCSTCGNPHSVRWRPESGHGLEREVLRRMARRLAVAWNMAEHVPTEALEAGVVAKFYERAEELAREVLKADRDHVLEAMLAADLVKILADHRFDEGKAT